MKHVYPQCPLCGCAAACVFLMMLLSANEARVCFVATCAAQHDAAGLCWWSFCLGVPADHCSLFEERQSVQLERCRDAKNGSIKRLGLLKQSIVLYWIVLYSLFASLISCILCNLSYITHGVIWKIKVKMLYLKPCFKPRFSWDWPSLKLAAFNSSIAIPEGIWVFQRHCSQKGLWKDVLP